MGPQFKCHESRAVWLAQCEIDSSPFQPGEGPSRVLLCDYDPLCGPSFPALLHTALPGQGGQGTIASCNDTEYRDLDLDTDLAYTKHHRNKEP